jgi:hypothetical protein
MTTTKFLFLSFGGGRDHECSEYSDNRKTNGTNHFSSRLRQQRVIQHKKHNAKMGKTFSTFEQNKINEY